MQFDNYFLLQVYFCHVNSIIYITTGDIDSMKDGYMAQIRKRVEGYPAGTVFITSDFSDIADATTVRQCLKRLVDSGKVRRIINGVYDIPEYSHLIGGNVGTDPEDVAAAIARNFKWTIAPTGDMALNLLGLDMQVPVTWSYVSDGPYRTYEWGNVKLQFIHRANREITGMSYKTGLVVQAMKEIGKKRMTPVVLERISVMLDDEEKKACLAEAVGVSDWIYSCIRKICS